MWARYKKLKQQPQFHQQFLVNPGYTLNVPFFLNLVCAFGPVMPLPSSPASSPNALPTSVPYSASTAAPAPVPVPAAVTIPSSAAVEESAYPPALSSLFQSATQAMGSFAPHLTPAHHHRGLHQQLQSPVDFVDPAIISSSSSSAFFPSSAAGQLLPDDPSIIAASAMGYAAPYLHGGNPYYHPYHPPHPPVGGHPVPPAVALMFANPYLSASAFPSPVPAAATAIMPPPFGHGGHGLVAEEADIDAEGDQEVICFQPPVAVQAAVAVAAAAHLGEAQQHLAGEDLIGEAIDEDEDEFDGDDSESESDYDDEEEEAVEGTNGKDVEESMDDDEDSDEEEEEEFIKGLIFGHDPEAYLQGLFWCLKMYMEGTPSFLHLLESKQSCCLRRLRLKGGAK